MRYSKLTLKELKSICKDNHLKNYSALNKTELIALIKKNKNKKQNKKKVGGFDGVLNRDTLRVLLGNINEELENINEERLMNLRSLYLNNKTITTIEPGAFNGLTNLELLDLNLNQITTIQSGSFEGLTNLKRLRLDYNQITTIQSGSFDGLTNLKTLELGYNQITTIQSGSFDGLTNLKTLELYHNQITTIQPGTFNGLTNLEMLQFHHNQITTIQSGSFEGLTNLKRLELDHNQITTIQPGSFDGLTNLDTLYLNSNQITTIQPGSFDGLTNLKRLYLNLNQITTIQPGSFDGLTNLDTLYLDNNFMDFKNLLNYNSKKDIGNNQQSINYVKNFLNTKKIFVYNSKNEEQRINYIQKFFNTKTLLSNNNNISKNLLLLKYCSKLKDEYNVKKFNVYLFIFRCLYKLIFKEHIKLPINPKKMDEKIKLLYVWMKIRNDKELSQLKYKNIMIKNMLQNEFILRIDDNIIKPNTDDKKSNNGNNTKYSIEYKNNQKYVRFIVSKNNDGNIISKNKLLQAKLFSNKINNNNNNTYMEIPNFNKILPYLQNINSDLPNNIKDLFYLFGISCFLDFTKLTNKIIDKIIDKYR
jgi:Leucine-rich repeat (LRR) protein